ncbi:MAG: CinA family protein [Burkholderiaceae bacterium]|nr:CinA family protein [Burkholderiaceae bacterium]
MPTDASSLPDREALLHGLAIGFGLVRLNARLMAAESCTGGLASHWITAIAGSSRWFDGGVVSYANEVKSGLLAVRETILRQHGAVSVETAAEMAEGMRRQHRRLLAGPLRHVPEGLFAFAVTGIAGPQGGQPGKPVGTVCFGWAGPQGVETERRCFRGDRAEIQRQACAWALQGLFARLCKTPSNGVRHRV